MKTICYFTSVIFLIIISGCHVPHTQERSSSITKLYTLVDGEILRINTATPIFIDGNEKGKVSDLNLKEGRVLMELSINKNIRITKSAKFYISPIGDFGDRRIIIENSMEEKEYYKNGDFITIKYMIK